MENEQYYIYGKLNQSEILKEYESTNTDTANTIVDNTNNTISVDVKKVPNALIIKDDRDGDNYLLRVFDGSNKEELNLNNYVTQNELNKLKEALSNEDLNKVELTSTSSSTNYLKFYNKKDELITEVELSGFTQVQGNLAENNPASEAYIQNKSTRFLTNEGDGTSPYATISRINSIIKVKVVKDISLEEKENQPDYLAIKKNFVNIASKYESSQSDIIPIATEEKSGLMSHSSVSALNDLQSRVTSLEGKTTRLLYTDSENPSKEDINNFVIGLGYTSPFSGIAVVVDKTFHIWHYYENKSSWQDDGQDTTSTFTNEYAGIIKGSNKDGQIYAEADGTGSVKGWDSVKQKSDKIITTGQGNSFLSDNGVYKEIDIDPDNQSITKNTENKIQTVGVKYNNELITAEMIYNATHFILNEEEGPVIDPIFANNTPKSN